MEDDFESVREFGEVDLADLRCWWCEGEGREIDVRGAYFSHPPGVRFYKCVCITPYVEKFGIPSLTQCHNMSVKIRHVSRDNSPVPNSQ